MTSDEKTKPYPCTMHYDPSVKGVWIGFGSDLAPACGHQDYIGVTCAASMVDCKNCLRSLEAQRGR